MLEKFGGAALGCDCQSIQPDGDWVDEAKFVEDAYALRLFPVVGVQVGI